MANISIRKSNFTVHNGYFYTFDEDQDALLQKTDDGNTAFSYPLDTLLTHQIDSLEYDGVYLWTMEEEIDTVPDPDEKTYYIKRWHIENYITKLQQTITIATGGSHIYSANCFTIEHYHTKLTTTVSGGETTIYIDDYSNNPNVIEDAILHLGPNEDGEEEEILVTGTVFGGVTLDTPIINPYDAEEDINFHRRLWLFNNYNGTDNTTGALYKFDSHTGNYISKYPGGAYKSITACTFYKINSFQDLGEKDMLMYAKGTNTLFVNVEEDLKTLYDADTVNDTFTGSNGSTPNGSRWTIEAGTPRIQSNTLEMGDYYNYPSNDEIQSVYYLPDDFDVYVDGELTGYDAGYSGSSYMENSLKLQFPNEQDRFCAISRGYSTQFGGEEYQNFSVIARKATDAVITAVSGTASDPTTDPDSYSLRLKRVETDVHFYYRTTTSGIKTSWNYLGVEPMFDSDAQLIISTRNTTTSGVTNNFDNVTYLEGFIAYISTATELPYYGSMVMDNVEGDGYSIVPLRDVAVDRNNMYRLHGSSTYDYSLSPLESFVTSISLSASPAIIAANGLSTTDIKAWVKDQFLQPIQNRRVTFAENGTGSITGGLEINTDADGFAQTIYTAGTSAQSVLITATVQQTN